MGRIFISYRREQGTQQKRLERIKSSLENHYHDAHYFVYDEREFRGGGEIRAQIIDNLKSADCVLVLWSGHSDWVFLEVAYAQFHDIPVLFLVDGEPPPDVLVMGKVWLKMPGTFGVDEVRAMDDLYGALDTIFSRRTSTNSAPPPAPADEPVMPLSATLVRTALLEELKHETIGGARRTRFERKFLTPANPDELERIEQDEVEKLLDSDLAEHGRDRYALRYKLGDFLSELGTLDDEMLSMTGEIAIPGKNRRFHAMRYPVTRQVFMNFLQDKQRNLIGHFPAPTPEQRYLPQLLKALGSPEDIEELLSDLGGWLADQIRLERPTARRRQRLRLPTLEEWTALASPAAQWDEDGRLAACNLASPVNPRPRIAAVGTFRGGVAASGAYDLIGNVWELCIDDPQARTPAYYIAGLSYNDVETEWHTRTHFHDLTRQLDGLDHLQDQDDIGFRFVTDDD
ncbi:MAG: TIR domain-containing protein [bacterium]|nr:TIR domain-containing protein [bacterium]